MTHLDSYVTLLPSIFDTSTFEVMPLREALERLTNEWRDEVERVRTLTGKAQKRAKEQLPAFAFSGAFKRSVVNDDLDVHSAVVIIDYDDVGDPWKFIGYAVEPNPHALAAWPSARGEGVKVLIALDKRPRSNAEHRMAFAQVCRHLDVTAQEESQHDVRRLCFVSAPDRIWINDSVVPFEVDLSEEAKPQRAQPVGDVIPHGTQHNTLVSLAGSMRRRGMDADAIFAALWQTNITRCEKPGSEAAIRKIAESMMGYEPALAIANGHAPDDEGSPAIPQRVYDLLPDAIQEGCAFFDGWHERDAYLTALIGTLSSTMPIVRLLYGKVYHSPHLNFFLLAMAASGKGVMEHAFRWIDAIDDHLIETSARERVEWQERKALSDAARRKGEPADDPGPEPPERFLRTAEDATAPELHESLAMNDSLLMASTEADAVSSANDKEFGRFTHLIRRAFHHESARKGTKTDGRVRVKHPRMAVVLSGTPDQFGRLIESVHDGTYSRFAVLRFAAPLEYESQRPTAKDRRFEAFTDSQSAEALRLWQILQSRRETVELGGEMVERPRPLYFDVSPAQWDRIDQPFKALFDRLFKEHHAPAALTATVKRGALIAFRIAMVIGVWRRFERDADSLGTMASLSATDDDIEVGASLGLVYAEHAIRQAFAEMARRGEESGPMPQTDDVGGVHRTTGKMRQLLDALPTGSFSTGDFDDASFWERVGFSRSTGYELLDKLIMQGHLKKPGHGKYEKPEPEKRPGRITGFSDYRIMAQNNSETPKSRNPEIQKSSAASPETVEYIDVDDEYPF